LLILTTAQMVGLCVGGVGVLLPMTGHERPWLRLSVIAVSMHLAASFLLVPRLGIVGGALATGGALVCLFLGGLALTRRWLGIWPYDQKLKKALWSLLVGSVAMILAGRLPLGDPLLHILLLGVLAAGAVGGSYVIHGLEPEERELLVLIRRRFPGRGGRESPHRQD